MTMTGENMGSAVGPIDLSEGFGNPAIKSWAKRQIGIIDKNATPEERNLELRRTFRAFGILALVCVATAAFQSQSREEAKAEAQTAAAVYLDRPAP